MAQAVILVNWQAVKKLEDFKCPDKLTCKVCKQEKDKEEFVSCASNRTGRRNKCKECERKRVEANAEKKKIDTEVYFDF